MRDLQIKGRRPGKIFGEGCSKEQEKMTTLTKYLEFETWPPVWAALLVSGIQPEQGCTEIPNGAFDLENSFISCDCDQFHLARWILELWNCRENAPSKVRPADFVLWCKSKNINTDWLDEIAVEPTLRDGAALSRSAPQAVPAKGWTVTTNGVMKHKQRINNLDAPIMKAIAKAGTLATATVFVQLKELALNEEKPFTGVIDGGALCYTNDDDKPAKLNKDGLRDRLKSHVLPVHIGG